MKCNNWIAINTVNVSVKCVVRCSSLSKGKVSLQFGSRWMIRKWHYCMSQILLRKNSPVCCVRFNAIRRGRGRGRWELGFPLTWQTWSLIFLQVFLQESYTVLHLVLNDIDIKISSIIIMGRFCWREGEEVSIESAEKDQIFERFLLLSLGNNWMANCNGSFEVGRESQERLSVVVWDQLGRVYNQRSAVVWTGGRSQALTGLA